jgi:hypothetical protein
MREQRGPAALEESYLSAAALLALSAEDEQEEGGDWAGWQGVGDDEARLGTEHYGSNTFGGSVYDDLVAEAEMGSLAFGTDITTATGSASTLPAQQRTGLGLVACGPGRQWGATEEGSIALRLVHALCTVPLQR